MWDRLYVQISGIGGGTTPVGNGDSNSPGGTSIAILFHKPLEAMKASDIKKMLTPVLDFEKHSTFNGDKVIKVKDSFAGLGTQVANPPVIR